MVASLRKKPLGYRWRSSRLLIVSSITVALFSETFLYGFLVPILSYILEDRLELDPSRTQNLTTALLTTHGFFGLVSAPVIAHFAGATTGQRTPLLIALAGCFVGTLLVASTYSLWALFLGRVLQSVAASATWVIGFALLTNNIPTEHLGKSLGATMSLVTGGIVGGPMVSGALLQLLGYWPAWSVPLAVLALDITARLLIVEPREFASPGTPNVAKRATSSSSDSTDTRLLDESTALLSESLPVNTSAGGEGESKTPSTPSYYRLLLFNSRILAGLLNIVISSSVLSGFNNTLPLHLRDTFGWGSLPTGMMFLCIQAPAIILGGLVGWLRDKAGIRAPTTFGWAASAPLLFFLGVPGDPRFPWAAADANGEALFISCLSAYGIVSMLVRGVGSMQMALAVNGMEAKDPEKFSAREGNLRVFSMTEIAYSVGTMVGPLLTGLLIEGVGFFYMNIIIAAICLFQAGVSFLYLDDKPASRASGTSI